MPKRLLDGIAPMAFVTTRNSPFESGAIKIGGGAGNESEYHSGRFEGRNRSLTEPSNPWTSLQLAAEFCGRVASQRRPHFVQAAMGFTIKAVSVKPSQRLNPLDTH